MFVLVLVTYSLVCGGSAEYQTFLVLIFFHATLACSLCSVYEAAIAAAGLDFRSDRLWEAYIDWQKNHSRLKEALVLFDRVLSVPTQQYSKHFDRLVLWLNFSSTIH